MGQCTYFLDQLHEFPNLDERRTMLKALRGIEDRVYVQVGDLPRVYAIADEDLGRSDDTKTSAVHFLRFELDQAQLAAIKSGNELAAGIDHDNYLVEVSPVAENVCQSLLGDLD